jgi:glycine cleavage system regulatory protein
MLTSLVVTVIGPDRPGLVRLLSDCGSDHGASWEESRMASLAGQFAGMVRFSVPAAKAAGLAAALTALEAEGLRVVIAQGEGTRPAALGRLLKLELVGHDRPGIVRDISRVLAEHGISIHELHTAVVSGAMSGGNLFQVDARLAVPNALATDDLRALLEGLANELMVDIALAE